MGESCRALMVSRQRLSCQEPRRRPEQAENAGGAIDHANSIYPRRIHGSLRQPKGDQGVAGPRVYYLVAPNQAGSSDIAYLWTIKGLL